MAFGDEVAKMMADVEQTFGVSITLTKYAKGARSATTGLRDLTPTFQLLLANRLPVRQVTRPIGDGRARDDVRVYEIVVSTVQIGEPEPGWTITDGDRKLHVTGVTTDAFGLNYLLECKGSV